jgi:hypothetical protein
LAYLRNIVDNKKRLYQNLNCHLLPEDPYLNDPPGISGMNKTVRFLKQPLYKIVKAL